MSTDRKIAWAGLILALPGIIALFRDEHLKVALLVTLLFLVFAGFLIFYERSTHRPGVTVLKVTKILTVADATGASATLLRCQEFVPNYPSIDSIWFRNIVSDGTITTPMIDGQPPDGVERLGCLLSVQKKYNKPLTAGEKHEVKLEYGLQNSFPASEEALLHDVEIATRTLVLEVNLPAARPAREVQLHVSAAGTAMDRIRKGLSLSPNNLHIVATIKNPKPGYTYELGWKW